MALVELLLIFGAVIAWCVYELITLKRDKNNSPDDQRKP